MGWAGALNGMQENHLAVPSGAWCGIWTISPGVPECPPPTSG
jgi:hypothetical protein